MPSTLFPYLRGSSHAAAEALSESSVGDDFADTGGYVSYIVGSDWNRLSDTGFCMISF